MKNTNSKNRNQFLKFSKCSFIFILLSTISFRSFGDEESDIERDGICAGMDLNEKMPVREFITTCDGGFHTSDGCKINVEKTCINGKEVDFLKLNKAHFAGSNLKIVEANGLSKEDFSNPNNMYNSIDGSSSKLCYKIDGLTGAVGELSENNINKNNNISFSSIPAFVKPTENIGSVNLRWKYEIINGKTKVTVKVTDFDSLGDATIQVGSTRATDRRGVATGAIIEEAMNNLFVQCKSDDTLEAAPNPNERERLFSMV